MRRLFLLTTIALLGASAAQAQTTLLADANRDGKVSAVEYQNHRRTFFMRADRDHDGKVSAQEWKNRAQMVRAQVRDTGVDGWDLIGKGNFFAALDANADGFATPAEMDTLLLKRFAAFDPNHDGFITATEARQIERSIPKP